MKQQVSRVVLAVILKSCGLWIAQHIHPLSTWFTLTTPAELSRSVYSPPSLRHSQPIIADEPLGNLPSFLCVLHALCLSFFSLVFSQITPSSAQLNSATAVPCRVVLCRAMLSLSNISKEVPGMYVRTCMRRPNCFPGACNSWHLQVACLHLFFLMTCSVPFFLVTGTRSPLHVSYTTWYACRSTSYFLHNCAVLRRAGYTKTSLSSRRKSSTDFVTAVVFSRTYCSTPFVLYHYCYFKHELLL